MRVFETFAPVNPIVQKIPLSVIAFTHKSTPLRELNRFFIPEEERADRLSGLRSAVRLQELLYIATCNRVEFILVSDEVNDSSFRERFFRALSPGASEDEVAFAMRHAVVLTGKAVLDHLYRVASSLDSLVVGEREIITQVRKSYDACKAMGLTGDLIRLVVQSTVNTAKRVFTETRIATNPVSVVSLAERRLRLRNLPKESRVVVIGSGETNTNLCKYLVKQGFRNFVIFNRTVENAESLAAMLNSEKSEARAFPLDHLHSYSEGFDLLVTCTGSAQAVVTRQNYDILLAGERGTKVIVDLAMPADIDPEVVRSYDIHYIGIDELKTVAERNLAERQSELVFAEKIIAEQLVDFERVYHTRNLELRMREVPGKFREIRERAFNEVFVRDLQSLDDSSRELLEKVVDYMEQKYISVPMVMAKEILLEKR
jgi:glutamyl-tRNA reductase